MNDEVINIIKEMYLISKKNLDDLEKEINAIQAIIKNSGYKNLENPDKIHSIFNEIERYCKKANSILVIDKD